MELRFIDSRIILKYQRHTKNLIERNKRKTSLPFTVKFAFQTVLHRQYKPLLFIGGQKNSDVS